MVKATYFDFDLWIGKSGDGYRAKGWDPHGREARMSFALPWSQLEIESFRAGAGAPGGMRPPENGTLRDFGAPLFEAVFQGDVLSCFRASLEEARSRDAGLRIRLRLAEVPELATLPWEYLFDKSLDRFFALSTATPVVRYLELPERIRPLEVEGPLRVLVMLSAPDDFEALDGDKEWDRLREAVADFAAHGMIRLDRLEKPSLPGLQRALRRDTFHVFHFIGHGGFRDRTEEGVLIFEDGRGGGQPVAAEHLGVLLHDHPSLRFALLNACEGARGSHTDAFAGVAQTLVRQGIPAVLGMQTEISDRDALTLAHELYRALADGYAVDAAITEARKAISGTGSVEWGTPALYLRAPDGKLFDIPHREATDYVVTPVTRAVLVQKLVDARELFAELEDVRGVHLTVRMLRRTRDLMARFGGHEAERLRGRMTVVFERVADAVAYAVDCHREIAGLGEELDLRLEVRIGIHFGEVWRRKNLTRHRRRGAQPQEIVGQATVLAARLAALAQGRQTLLTHAAFELARRGVKDDLARAEMRWLAHGPYAFEGLDEVQEIFEVGVANEAPLRAPPDVDVVRKVLSPEEETLLGWRPARGGDVPGRPGWVLEKRLAAGTWSPVGGSKEDDAADEIWLAGHKTGEKRVFKYCFEASRLKALKGEVALFRLLREALGRRRDIASVLDWNLDENPFFVEVEYSEHGDLRTWARGQGGIDQVPLATRLELVTQICEALAAAHSVGVLHNHLRPANVLVTLDRRQGRPRAMISGFDVSQTAKEALATVCETLATRVDKTAVTDDTGQLAAALYLAPEVLEGRDTTVQSDLYAVGVLLYQMVVGDLSRAMAPGWRRDLDDGLLADDVARMVDRSPARRPDSAFEIVGWLRTLDERRADRLARAEARTASRALEQSRRRRRHLLLLTAGLLIVVLALALQERRTAREAQRANRERETARQVSEFLIGLFEVSDPGENPGETLTAREILDRSRETIHHRLKDQPEVQATLLTTLGRVYGSLGLYATAAPLLDDAVARLRELPGPPRPQLAASVHELARLHFARGAYPAALTSYHEALALRRQLFGEVHPDVAVSLNDLSLALLAAGDSEEGEARLREAYEMNLELFGEEHRSVAASLLNLGRVLEAKGETAAAEEHLGRALDIQRRVLGELHPDIAVGLNNLGALFHQRGDLVAAERLLRQALEQKRRIFGDVHPEVAVGLNNLAVLRQQQDDTAAAAELYSQAVAMYRQLFEGGHPNLGTALVDLGLLELRSGDATRAEGRIREARQIFDRVLPAGHWRGAHADSVLGACLGAVGRFEEAEPLVTGGYEGLRQAKGDAAETTRDALERVVALYEAWGRPEEAERYRASDRR